MIQHTDKMPLHMAEELLRLPAVEHTLFYLAMPFSHKHFGVRTNRLNTNNRFCAALLQVGLKVLSPLAHSAPLVPHITPSYDWVNGVDLELVRRCNAVILAKVPGWKQSPGVTAELKVANNMPNPLPVFAWNYTQIKDFVRAVTGEKITQRKLLGLP